MLLATCFHAGNLLGLFDHKDGGDMFLRNIGRLATNYTALYPHKIELFAKTAVRTSEKIKDSMNVTSYFIFSDVRPCTLVDVWRRLGKKYCLHLQGRRVSQASGKEYKQNVEECRSRGPERTNRSTEVIK
jgi:hypothetical protein